MVFFKKSKEVDEEEINPLLLCDKERFSEFSNQNKVDMLKAVIGILEENNIKYFAFGRILEGCVHYGEFGFPNGPWDLAVFREDYDKVDSLFCDAVFPKGVFYDKYYDDERRIRKEIIKIRRDKVYKEGDIEVECRFYINISPFDKIPEEFDLQNSLKRRTRRANAFYKKYVNVCTTENPTIKDKVKKAMYTCLFSPERAYKMLTAKATAFSYIETNLYGRVQFKKSAFVTGEQILPVVKRPFYDFELACPADYTTWTDVMNDDLKNQIDTIQKADLLLLETFDKICRKLDIGYFICGGTMLGQVRHGGFIPWDDDIDVALLRKDYDRFIKEGAPLLDDRFFMQTRESDPEIPYLFSKIRLNNSTYLTKYNERRNLHKGICLDLFPFDVVPDDLEKREKFVSKVIKRSKKHNKVVNIAGPEPEYDHKPVNLTDWYFRWFGRIHRFVYKLIPLTITQRRYIKLATKYNDKLGEPGYTTVASFVPSYTFISLDDLLPYRDVDFENIKTKIPNRAEVFLEMQYGDYMELPPQHKQIGHGLIGWSLDN